MQDTSASIVEAAEVLFAEQGFTETTVRQITSAAGVNLAAVNYHFGSKKGLIQAVAEKLLVPLCDHIDNALVSHVATSNEPPTLEEALEMLMRALLAVNKTNIQALPVFMRLLELAYMKNQGELRDFLIERYAGRLTSFVAIMRNGSAMMEDDEFFWRIHFLLGSITFTLSNVHTIAALEKRESEKDVEIEQVMHRMVPVLAAGLQARAEKTYFCRI